MTTVKSVYIICMNSLIDSSPPRNHDERSTICVASGDNCVTCI